MSWILGGKSVWGPINHNEGIRSWRMKNWPLKLRIANYIKSFLRIMAWRLDPLLFLAKTKSSFILSAGSWVDFRLSMNKISNVIHRSQLGIDVSLLPDISIRKIDGLRLVSGGRLDWIKGLDIAIESLSLLPLNSTLTIIGDGPCKNLLESKVNDLDLQSRVIFIPRVSREELMNIYLQNDIFIFPSAEAGGLAWVEALSVGIPVVGFKGHSELDRMSSLLTGIQVADDSGDYSINVINLANSIIKVKNQKYESASIASSARNYYSWDNFSSEVIRLYHCDN